MSAIKRFFEKRKLDVKFKTAGSGHKLTEDTRQKDASGYKRQISEGRDYAPSKASQTAGAAALNRIDRPNTSKGPMPGTSAAAIKAQAKRELEEERARTAKAHQLAELYSAPKEIELDGSPMLAVEGAYFKCPMAGSAVLPKREMEDYIKNFLYSQLGEEPEMATALMIHTLNKEPEKVNTCIDTLCKYIDNILSNPNESKYHKIRVNNKAFIERVSSFEGTAEFLQAAGFEKKQLPGPNNGASEDFLVMDEDNATNLDRLRSLKEVLLAAEPIKPELDRNLKVYRATGNPAKMVVPPDFYRISPDELKREQQARNEAVERMGMLRTKEMRERERQRELRKYRYCLIRVRFPDGIILQGTFKATDKLLAVFDFVKENLELDWIPFTLSVMGGSKLEESAESESLAELQLVPASMLHFNYDASVLADVTGQRGGKPLDHYLKTDLLSKAKPL